MIQRQTLNIDLDQLFPAESVPVGDQSILIRPLNIEQLATIMSKLKGMGSVLSEDGVTWTNFNEPENMFKIAIIILANFSDVLEEASNVEIKILKQLPLDIIVKVINKIIEVNLKSKEDLSKNLGGLMKKFLPEEEEAKEAKDPQPKKKLKKI